MADIIKRALTRRRARKGRVVSEEPDAKLVYAVKFSIGAIACFSVLEVAHLAFLGVWNSEIFAAITGLSGTVMGIFVGKKA